jgi:DnaJ-class molecular chaperone
LSANIEKVITLSPVEARAGLNLRLANQVEKRCPTCRGEGERAIRLSNTARDTIECEDCEGFGVIDALETIEIKIEKLNGNRDERKFVYDGLGNY